MRVVDILEKKKQGQELSSDEIEFLIKGYVDSQIPDYQMAAFCMAVHFKGLSTQELTSLTLAMAQSGSQLDFDGVEGFIMDKHSSGGVGDKITLILAPLAAACGLKVAKMSGRALGHTGGTIDKLEAIKGCNVSVAMDSFIAQLNSVGCAITSQTKDVAVADKLLYALRDVTATVDNIPLIASSIMSKKLAMRSHILLLDVKVGDGALMKTHEDAHALAQTMVNIGKGAGKNTVAFITNMDEPLGYAIGNALEVQEAIDTLQGNGPFDVATLSIEFVAHALVAAKKALFIDDARRYVKEVLESGKAYDVFVDMLIAQGICLKGGVLQLPSAPHRIEVRAQKTGFVEKIETEKLGVLAMKLGAGREKKGDSIDYAVGMIVRKKVGELVEKGEVLATIHSQSDHESMGEDVRDCFTVGTTKKDTMLIHKIIR